MTVPDSQFFSMLSGVISILSRVKLMRLSYFVSDIVPRLVRMTMMLTLFTDIVPSLVNDIVPTHVNDIVSTLVNNLVPTYFNNIVPNLFNDVIPILSITFLNLSMMLFKYCS